MTARPGSIAMAGSIPQRAAVLARIGTAGQGALVPVDPDRLTAAERPDHAAGLAPEGKVMCAGRRGLSTNSDLRHESELFPPRMLRRLPEAQDDFQACK